MTVRFGDFEFDHVVYDDCADVLYLSAGPPREPAHQEATPDGHLVRYDENDRVIGLTVVNAKWLVERNGKVEIRIHVGGEDLAPALV